jgi:REP element-mobilizing transposase RayT
VFLCRADFRYFRSCVARVVRRGLLELHAEALMRTHFHLLVRSPIGHLDEAMRLLQNRYSRYLNRRLRRDGSLWRGRYKSKRVRSRVYHLALVSYIDANALKAAKVCRPADYPWGSATLYARKRRPRWLITDWVEQEVRDLTGRSAEDPDAYHARFPIRCDPTFLRWIERRLEAADDAADDLDELLAGEPAYVRAWLQRKTVLADGRHDSLPVTTAASVQFAVDSMRAQGDAAPGDRRRSEWRLVEAGLLRDGCCLAYPDIAQRLGSSRATAHAHVRAHRDTLDADRGYADLAASCLRLAIAHTTGGGQVTRPEAP